MQAKLFYGALISFTVGIGVETVYGWQLEVILWVLLQGLASAMVWRRKSEAFSAPYLLLGSICLVAFSVGLLRTDIAAEQFGNSPLEQVVDTDIELRGVVTAEPDYREHTVQLYVETDTDKVLVSADRLLEVSYGDAVVVTGRLERPSSFTTDLGREFDYAAYLKARGVEYRVSFAEVEVAGSGKGNSFIAGLLLAKQRFITTLEQVIPEPAVGLGNGLLLGVQSALGEDVEEDFRRTGIIHIVVLSGYNVMLVVAFILFCFSFFLPLRWRLVSAVIAIVCFALIVGLSATVVRASVMASLVLLAQFLGRRYNVLRALLFAGAVMLFINPYLLFYDIGFQLSFMATLGLVLLLPHFESTVVQKGRSIGPREFFLSTLATQIAVLPLLMYHIGEVSVIALVVNVLVLPMVPVAMLLTFITGVLGTVSLTVASLVGYAATFSLQYILWVAHFFATLPFATVTVPEFSAWGVLVLYTAMGVGWYWWQHRRKGGGYDEWEIVEEVEWAGAEAAKGRASAPARDERDLPIFFR